MYEIVLIIGLLGVFVGSFLNAYVWRLRVGKRVRAGRSMCPDCEHTLGATDLVPILSWIGLRGKCRYCRQSISVQYPAVELLTGVTFAVSAALWPFPPMEPLGWVLLAVWLVITALCIVLATYDINWYELPARPLRMLLGAAILWQFLFGLYGAELWEWLWSPLLGALSAFAFFYAIHIIGQGRWMGGGDVKLVFVLGLLVGLLGTLVGLFIAFVSGAVVGLALIATRRKGRRDMVPFGPFLLAGFWVAFFFAEELVVWYQQLLLGDLAAMIPLVHLF